MSLRNKPQDPAPGQFEDMDGETAVAEAPAAEAPAEPTTAVVVASPKAGALSTEVKANAGKFAEDVKNMKGAANFAYGNYTVFKGNNGTICGGDPQIDLGRWIKGTMIGWDDHWEVSPGSQNPKSKDAVAFSYQGNPDKIERVIGKEYKGWEGKSLVEYRDYLRQDYPNAEIRHFVDIAFVVLESENDEGMAGEIVQVTLSQSSIPSFNQYDEKLKQKARAIERGVPGIKLPEDPFTFYFLRELAVNGSNKWTKLKVLDKLPAKI